MWLSCHVADKALQLTMHTSALLSGPRVSSSGHTETAFQRCPYDHWVLHPVYHSHNMESCKRKPPSQCTISIQSPLAFTRVRDMTIEAKMLWSHWVLFPLPPPSSKAMWQTWVHGKNVEKVDSTGTVSRNVKCCSCYAKLHVILQKLNTRTFRTLCWVKS